MTIKTVQEVNGRVAGALEGAAGALGVFGGWVFLGRVAGAAAFAQPHGWLRRRSAEPHRDNKFAK